MQPPTLRRGRWVAVAALVLCLAPLRADASIFTLPIADDDSTRLLLDRGRVAPLGTSLFDLAALASDTMVWFDESPPAPVAPVQRVVFGSADEIIRRHEDVSSALPSTASYGGNVIDAWFLLTTPFLLTAIQFRRPRQVSKASKAHSDRLAELGPQAKESALDAIVRSPSEAASLAPGASPM